MKIETFDGRPMWEWTALGFAVRFWWKQWSLPYCWRRYGLWAFGAGPAGFNVWTPWGDR